MKNQKLLVFAVALLFALSASAIVAAKSDAYVHQANCKAALAGANGDDDISAWINTHTPYGIYDWSWSSGYSRVADSRFVQYVDMYNGSPRRWWGNVAGYCMGDDSNIVDKMGDAPAGW